MEKANNEILTHHPIFLKRLALEKIITKKSNSLRQDLLLATLFNLKLGFILKFLFKAYFVLKKRFILILFQLEHFLTANTF